MAKKAKVEKLKKQTAVVEKYAAKRLALKEAKDYEGLQKLPRHAPEKTLPSNRAATRLYESIWHVTNCFS